MTSFIRSAGTLWHTVSISCESDSNDCRLSVCTIFAPNNKRFLLSLQSPSLFAPSSPAVQSAGFTVVVDARQVSWHVAKQTLKSLQHTFAERISQAIVVKPKSFWRRPKLGTLSRKSKYSFSVSLGGRLSLRYIEKEQFWILNCRESSFPYQLYTFKKIHLMIWWISWIQPQNSHFYSTVFAF